MPAKRKSRGTRGSAGAGFSAKAARRQAEAVEPTTPVTKSGDGGGTDREFPVPKAGPVARDAGRFTGVGRGRDSAASRRYAFRRS